VQERAEEVKAFKHINATSIEETIALIRTYNGRACLMAGGTDLLGILKDEVLPIYPEAVINIKTIAGLDHFENNNGGFKIGALAKLVDVVSHPLVRKRFPILSQAAQAVATPEIRNMATLGGNICQDTRCWYYRYPHHMGGRIICHRKGKGPCQAVKGDSRYHAIMGAKKCFAVCPSDTAIALSVLDAGLEITGSQGARHVSINDFFTNLGNILKTDELLTGVHLPNPAAGAKQAFFKFTVRKPVDFAVVSVAAVGTRHNGICQELKIALGAVAPTPLRAREAEEMIRGKRVSEKRIKDAARLAVKQAKPMRMNAYKVGIARALVERALCAVFQ
jgi:xanthine dehydrogenase YagS FAD-binding subunit